MRNPPFCFFRVEKEFLLKLLTYCTLKGLQSSNNALVLILTTVIHYSCIFYINTKHEYGFEKSNKYPF